MTILDILIVASALLAAVMGWRSGLLRSLATILGYAIAAPIAVALTTPKVAPLFGGQTEFAFLVILLAAGFALGALLRYAVGEFAGDHIGPFDRLAGALLGVVRIGLLAVLMVLIFEQIVPQNRQPPWLRESLLRPPLLAAGQAGLRKLPPDLTATIDRLMRERGL